MRTLVNWVRRLARSDRSAVSHRPRSLALHVEELENRLVPSFILANFGSTGINGQGAGLYEMNTAGGGWFRIAPTALQYQVDAQGDVVATFSTASGATVTGLQYLAFGQNPSSWTLLSSTLPIASIDGQTIAISNGIVVAYFPTAGGQIQETRDPQDGANAHWSLVTSVSIALASPHWFTLAVDANAEVFAQFNNTGPATGMFLYIPDSNNDFIPGTAKLLSSEVADMSFPGSQFVPVRMDANGDLVADFASTNGGTTGSLQFLSHDAGIGSSPSTSWILLANLEASSFAIGSDIDQVVAIFTNAGGVPGIQEFTGNPSSWKLLDNNPADNYVGIDNHGNVAEWQKTQTPGFQPPGIYFLGNGNGPGQWVALEYDTGANGPPLGKLNTPGFDQIEVGSH